MCDPSFIKTRGHARFARSPLVIRLGDSRIRLGNSGYREVLSSGWHYNYKIGTITFHRDLNSNSDKDFLIWLGFIRDWI